jgi:hypothetical protein
MAKATSEEKEQAIQERRWKVWRLRVVQHLDISEIVKAVGVCRRTVVSDLAEMRKHRREHIRQAVAEQNAALDASIEVIEECAAVRRQAWSDLLTEPRGTTVRARLMSVLLQAIGREIEIRQSLGLLDRAAEEVILSDGSVRDLTDEETDKLLAAVKAELRSRNGGTAAGGRVGGTRTNGRKAGKRNGRGN